MKSKLLFLLTFLSVIIFAQSTDLDRFHFQTKDVRPAQKYTDPEKRTFSVAILENNTGVEVDPSKIIIDGFTKNDASSTYAIDFKFPNTIIYGEPEVVYRQEVNKDKDGRITSTRDFYKVTQKIEAKGTCYVNKEVYSNPSHSEFFSTAEYSSSSLARENYLVQKSTWRENFRNAFQQEIYKQTNNYINKDYGFTLRNRDVRLWLLGNEKHPEYTNHQNALKIVKDAFSKVDYYNIPASFSSDITPAISIFENEIKTYTEDNKKHKKVRYSAYYNLMKIYYHSDDFVNAEKYANLLITNDYDEKDGKEMLEEIQTIKKLIEANKLTSTHFEVKNETRYQVNFNEY